MKRQNFITSPYFSKIFHKRRGTTWYPTLISIVDLIVGPQRRLLVWHSRLLRKPSWNIKPGTEWETVIKKRYSLITWVLSYTKVCLGSTHSKKRPVIKVINVEYSRYKGWADSHKLKQESKVRTYNL